MLMRDVTPIINVAKEAAEQAALAKKPEIIEIDGLQHIKQGGELKMFVPPRPSALTCDTLEGVVDYVKRLPDAQATPLFLHVVNYKQVRVLSAPSGPDQARTVWLTATVAERWIKKCQ